MIDQNKINEYVATMLENANGAVQTGTFAFKQLSIGEIGELSEDSLHKACKYIIAKEKKIIEENPFLTKEQKDSEKNQKESAINLLEETLKKSLKQQGRLT